jgi:hypothetical protein
MCLRKAPEKYIAGAALDRAGVDRHILELCRRREVRRLPFSSFFFFYKNVHFLLKF